MPRYHIEQVETAYRTTTYTIDAADDEAALAAVGDEFGDEGDWKNHETVEITIVPVDPPGPSAHEQRLIDAAAQATANRRAAPFGLKSDDGGPCVCASAESHEGPCLGGYCYCH